jgi:prepilin-type processing-associated H-X9-DG protein
MYQYAQNMHEIGACPTNKRRTTTGTEWLNMWGSRTGVEFDYTMEDSFEGLRLSTQAFVGYIRANANNAPRSIPSNYVGGLTIMRGVPLFWEESTKFYNQQYRDGMFSNMDQLTGRHSDGGHVCYTDGSAELLKLGTDHNENVQTQSADFEANDLFINVKGDQWYSASCLAYRFNFNMPYGWANNPY